jgi:hypothetical protein
MKTAECPFCAAKWSYLKETAPNASLVVVETERTYEQDYEDPMTLNNLKGTSELEHKKVITRRWSQSYVVEKEKTSQSGHKAEIAIAEVATLSASAEAAIREKYALNETVEQVYSDEIPIKVPPHTKRQFTFVHKRLWQYGFIKYRSKDGLDAQIPFKVAVGANFDLVVSDETE